ncbi:MAG: hypothetical protein SVY10_08910 [Thermodesulfobacteriota bacterium]|nr:hypothetical protein [Thermodesulfobacteriota bacterium]
MQIGEKILNELDTLRKRHDGVFLGSPSNSMDSLHPKKVKVEEDLIRVEVEVLDVDRLGCSINKLEITKLEEQTRGENTCQSIKQESEEIKKRITYLQENMKIIESDALTSTALFRSWPPETRDNSIDYYEINLSGGHSMPFERYRFDRVEKKRTSIPINLTKDIFSRLVNDLACIMKG